MDEPVDSSNNVLAAGISQGSLTCEHLIKALCVCKRLLQNEAPAGSDRDRFGGAVIRRRDFTAEISP
jgi:hypothetical protein